MEASIDDVHIVREEKNTRFGHIMHYRKLRGNLVKVE